MMRSSISLLRHRNRGFTNADSAVGGISPTSSHVVGGGEGQTEIETDTVSDSIGGEGGEGKKKREKNESPPADDVCPICFGNFTIPCKTNCGHWFCGSCILQFWNYKASLQRCKCPICSRLISMLTPEACLLSRQEKEVLEVLENVQRYNRLFQGGIRGLLQNVVALPLLIKRMLQGLMDPDRFRLNYYTARLVGLMLGFLYQISPFNFIPTGGYAPHRLFELFAMSLVVILCLVGLCCRAILRRRLRRLAAAHTWTNV